MNKLYRLFTLSLVALLGLSLTGCGSKDDLDTNPYNRSGINIIGFGPSPILRTQEIHITGTNLGSVSEVVFAGKVSVARSAFNKADDQNIYVDVPDASLAGKIRLLVGTDTVATSITPLTFEEPIEITSISPTEGLSAGDEVTVKGDYLYNIYQAIFTCGVVGAPVNVEDFTYVSRHEIRFIVPLDAESGVITFTDGADWTEEYKTPLEIIPGTYESLSTTTSDFGQQITINGMNLHTIETVMFPGGVMADFTVSDDHNTITTTVPEETKSGAITLVLYSGASITTDELQLPEVEIDQEKFSDLKVGDVITLTGKNFDRIKSITLPGYGDLAPEEYTISGNELVFIVPEDMTDGTVELKQNSFITKTFRVSMYSEAPEVVIWAGSKTIGNWDGSMGDLSWGAYDWSTVQPGQTLYVYLTPDMSQGWSQIRLGDGSWNALPGTGGEIPLSADDSKISLVLTQEVLDVLINNGGLVLCGAYYTVTKVTLSVLETVLWKGELGPTNWSGDKTIPVTDEIKEQLQAGEKMGINFKCDAGGGQVEICGAWWTGLEGPKNVYGTDAEGRAIMNFAEDVTNFEWTLTQGDIDILTTQGAILFVGNGGLTITRWYVK